MSLKEFSVRCSAITQITAHAYGIVRAMGPRRPAAHTRSNRQPRHQQRAPGQIPSGFACKPA